jgi:hypothetical protein
MFVLISTNTPFKHSFNTNFRQNMRITCHRQFSFLHFRLNIAWMSTQFYSYEYVLIRNPENFQKSFENQSQRQPKAVEVLIDMEFVYVYTVIINIDCSQVKRWMCATTRLLKFLVIEKHKKAAARIPPARISHTMSFSSISTDSPSNLLRTLQISS